MLEVFLFTDKVILHYTLILVASGCRKTFSHIARRLLTHCLPAGTRIQLMAWNLANSLVTQYVTLAVTRPENQHHLIEPTFRGPLSLADLIVLVHRLGLGQAAGFVAVVDPWKYPDEATTVVPVIKSYIQGAVDKATHAGKTFHSWTEESKTEYLLFLFLFPAVAFAVSEQAMPSSHLKDGVGQVRVHLRHARAACVPSHCLSYAWAHARAD